MTDETKAQPDLTKGYEPREVEERWYSFWEKNGVFAASEDPSDKRPVYVLPIPPPNVTGSLHMGHALGTTLQDTLVRYHRMRGFNTLWQPGIDHAGIATQTVVERQLLREGKTRHDIGREAFMERIWAWKEESGGRIEKQIRILGASCDWPRSKFTMDADMERAVRHAFVKFHEEGLMYRATRLINWDPIQQTSLSDLEVEHEETNGELFEFAYQVFGSDEEIVVATTRPETMLGDTAVAVHPEDPRYLHLHGKFLVHPFVERRVPVVADSIGVDPKFGTGAVKITPAHDWNDFALGKRHGLAEINILNLDGTINENGGQFQGLERSRARTAVKKALADLGLTRGAKPHRLTVPKSQRSGAVVEPMLSTQWFLKMDGMAQKALDAVKNGDTVIIPGEWQKTYDHFLENIQDWCVSRQLWWGHQIPAWHGPNGEIRVAMERPAECGEGWTQDPDVLDTWFSSGLWPFATQGWPEQTPALKKLYPAADLETGYDILFFWVARMMMMGLHFTGQVPFKRVLLHGLIVDETGDKMSKVKGNVIDPLDLVYGATFAEMVKKTLPGAPEAEALSKFKKAYPSAAGMGEGFPAFGADAVRFTLATYPPSNKRIALAPKRIEGYKHFLNKIWNATRFSMSHLEGFTPKSDAMPEATWVWNQWILAELAKATGNVHGSVAEDRGFAAFRIDTAANALYDFFWTGFCDWYLEVTKTVFGKEPANVAYAEETKATLAFVLERSLRLLHPFIPYVTEELWQRLPKAPGAPISLALARYPEAADFAKAMTDDRHVRVLKEIVSSARSVRTEYDVHPAATVPFAVRADDAKLRALFTRESAVLTTLVKTTGAPVIEAPGGARPAATVVQVISTEWGPVEVLVGLKGLVTADKEKARIERELKKIDKDLAILDKKLKAPGFADRAPPEVVVETKQLQKSLGESRLRLEAAKVLAEEL